MERGRGGKEIDLKYNDKRERNVVKILNKGRPFKRLAKLGPHILIAKLIQIGFVLNTGPEA